MTSKTALILAAVCSLFGLVSIGIEVLGGPPAPLPAVVFFLGELAAIYGVGSAILRKLEQFEDE